MATLTITDLAAEWRLIKLLDSALPLIPNRLTRGWVNSNFEGRESKKGRFGMRHFHIKPRDEKFHKFVIQNKPFKIIKIVEL